MDEPFSAVDTLTRIGLEGLVRALWQELALTILFVFHDVDEGAYLSPRVVALSSAPATVALDVPIDLPSPRNQITTRALSEYLDYRARLLAQVFARDEVANIGAP
jgi:NitT/TauT family transport system ATP-binding protein